MKYFHLAVLSTSVAAVSKEQENLAVASLSDLWTPEDKGLTPAAVRFGFHSCFGNGCNGCIDFENEANNGLQKIYDELNDIYDNFLKENLPEGDTLMSRADFWALASWHAAVTTLPEGFGNYADDYKFVYGRMDCSTSPMADYEKIAFPDEKGGVEEIMRCFGPTSIFGFTQDECVALIAGGHSLGRGHLGASGYEGPWDVTPETMDSQFVYELVNDQWTQSQTPDPYNKWQYYNDKFDKNVVDSLCFNTDVALLKELTPVDEETGQIDSTCSTINPTDGSGSCPDSVMAEKTRFYAEQGDVELVPDFLSVYYRMVTTTMENLELVEATGSGSMSLSFASFVILMAFIAQ